MNDYNQNICIHCGFCCDGTLFNHATIKESETIAPGYCFEILPDKKKAFKQPCPYYKNQLCAIYEDRPYSVCESFKCKLLRAVNSGELTFNEAMKIIDDTQALKMKIGLQLLDHHPENTGVSINQKMKDFNTHFTGQMSEPEFRKKYGKLLLDFFILNKKINESFKKRLPEKDGTEGGQHAPANDNIEPMA